MDRTNWLGIKLRGVWCTCKTSALPFPVAYPEQRTPTSRSAEFRNRWCERKRERDTALHSERSATCIRFGVEARQDPLSGKVHTGRSVPPSLAPTSLGGRLSQPFLPFFQRRTHWLEEDPLSPLSLSSSIDVGTTRAINLERRSLLGNMPARIPNAHNRRVTSSTTLRFSPR